MKKILFTAVSALAISAAIAADSTQFGVLPVTAPTTRTLVAVPWCEASTTGSNVAISNLILTANLHAGDTLDALANDGTTLGTWTLTAGAGDVFYWKAPVNIVTSKGVQSGIDAAQQTVARGLAVALTRKGTGTDLTNPFYVMGQVASGNPSVTISPGQGNAPCYNMIAPPSTVAQKLNSTSSGHCAAWSGNPINENDRIIIPTQYLNIELKYADGEWRQAITTATTKYYKPTYNAETKKYDLVEVKQWEPGAISQTTTTTEWTPYDTAIPCGTGFWYVSYGGSPTVTWSDVPMKN